MGNGKLDAMVPKLPSTNLSRTFDFYSNLGFEKFGGTYPDYLMMTKDGAELHFFLFEELNPLENYGMCYVRVTGINDLYEGFKSFVPESMRLKLKPWNQKEFSLLDPDHNLLTFGEHVSQTDGDNKKGPDRNPGRV